MSNIYRCEAVEPITSCAIEGCTNPDVARGLCIKHYQHLRKIGLLDNFPRQKRKRQSTCIVDGCDKKSAAHGLCATHYYRLKRYGSTDDPPKRKLIPRTQERTRLTSTDRPKRIRATCSVDGCENPHKARGFCSKHYYRMKKHGSTDDPPKCRSCSVEGCDRSHASKGLCAKHYSRLRRRGSTDDPPQRTKHNFRLDGPTDASVCSVDGCTNPPRSQGLCHLHYERMRTHGSTDEPKTGNQYWYEVYCANGAVTIHQGAYERDLALTLDSEGALYVSHPDIKIPWVDAGGKHHNYHPDFYLPNIDVYVDTKNKWIASISADKLTRVQDQNPDIKLVILTEEVLHEHEILDRHWDETLYRDITTKRQQRQCSIEGCENPLMAKGLCEKHYTRMKARGSTDDPFQETCTIEGCDNPHKALGLCKKHYARLRKHGSTDDPSRPKQTNCSVDGCADHPIAKGLCRKHYQQIWKQTHINTQPTSTLMLPHQQAKG